MKRISLLVIGIAALISVPLFSVATQAQSTNTVSEAVRSAARCAIAEGKLEVRETRVQSVIAQHTQVFNALNERLSAVIEEATQAEYDTSALVAAQSSVTTAIDVFIEKGEAYTGALTTVKDAACGESDTTYADALSAARTALRELREATTEVRTVFRSEIIPALQDYVTSSQTTTVEEDV